MSDNTAVDPLRIRMYRDVNGSVSVTIAGDRPYRHVGIVRAAPLSDPDHFVSIVDADGQEIAMIAEPSRLEPETRRILEEELSRRYVSVPIRRIRSARNNAGVWHIEVETDGGRRELLLRDLGESIRCIGGTRYVLQDSGGSRFEIPDARALDKLSTKLLDRLI